MAHSADAAYDPGDPDGVEEPRLRTADGRVPGRRGLATRRRLLECTAGMLATSSYRELKVIDIAREANTSPATFYQYFPDVESAVLVLAEEMAAEVPALAEIVRAGDWRGRPAFDTCLALADAFIDYWDRHRSVLRVVELATGEGDRRFNQIRSRMLTVVTDALADAVVRNRREPGGLDPTATAAVLVAMLANVASHRYGFEFYGIRTEEARRSMAAIIHWAVTGRRPPEA